MLFYMLKTGPTQEEGVSPVNLVRCKTTNSS